MMYGFAIEYLHHKKYEINTDIWIWKQYLKTVEGHRVLHIGRLQIEELKKQEEELEKAIEILEEKEGEK